MHAGKPVARQAIRRSSGGIIELGEQLVKEVVGISRQVELPVGLGPMFLPVAVVVDQIPERDMLPALGEANSTNLPGLSRK